MNDNAQKREPLEAPLRQNELKLENNCSASDMKLLDQCKHTQDVYNLINLSNFLSIKSLFVLSCGKIASLVRNQSSSVVEEILKPNFSLATLPLTK